MVSTLYCHDSDTIMSRPHWRLSGSRGGQCRLATYTPGSHRSPFGLLQLHAYMSKLLADRRSLVAPMLATSSPPFDHPEYVFETKWDGVRALMAIQNDMVRIWGRHLQDYSDRYPELHALPFPD